MTKRKDEEIEQMKTQLEDLEKASIQVKERKEQLEEKELESDKQLTDLQVGSQFTLINFERCCVHCLTTDAIVKENREFRN